ncbi:diacylglycerol/lipid kinase family protein [Devosia sp.]|uniref:diacylglycerol/lipid kinase family protein n=1 Tax=Devosia sp. TaxID=1871048 RepID=UPI003BABEEEE
MQEISYHILLNARSGAAATGAITPQVLQEFFSSRGDIVSIDADTSIPFAKRLQRAAASPAKVLLAAGGDGTATALAQVAIEAGKTLALMPLGTANLLARDLSIPLVVEKWLEGLAEMEPRRIDVGEVNGRIFLHKVVIGAVPGIALAREQIRGRSDLAAKLGFFAYFVRRLARIKRFAAEITPESGDPRIERVQSIAVANNDYAAGVGQVFTRPRLDAGTLSLYLVRHLSFADALRLGAGMLMGTWRTDEAIEIENVKSLVIRTRSRRLNAMVDGEVIGLEGPLTFRIRPLALSILAPKPAPEPAVEPTAAVAVGI